MKGTTKVAKALRKCFDIFQECLEDQSDGNFTLTNIRFKDDNYILDRKSVV